MQRAKRCYALVRNDTRPKKYFFFKKQFFIAGFNRNNVRGNQIMFLCSTKLT